ncbi:MAG: ABC transporter ATP-binding protein [Alphaproteobacteria bacterium]
MMKRLVGGYVRPHWGPISVALLLMAVTSAITAGLAMSLEPVIDLVLIAQDRAALHMLAIGLFVAFIARGGLTYIGQIMMNKVGNRITASLQSDLSRHVLGLDLGWHHANPQAEILSRMISDADVARKGIIDTLRGFGQSVLTLLFLIGVMIHQDWQLTLWVAIVFPAAGLAINWIGRKLRKAGRRTQAGVSDLTAGIGESFGHIRQVQIDQAEGAETDRLDSLIERLFKLRVKAYRYRTLMEPISQALIGGAIVMILMAGGQRVLDGAMTSGQLFSFITAFLLAFTPLRKLGNLWGTLQTALASAERLLGLMDTKPTIQDADDAAPLDRTAPMRVSFDQVSFSYAEGEAEALRTLSFTAEPGQTVALVGPSGAGKSTILNLIPRFYDVDQGCVSVAGQDVRKSTLDSLREVMALVSQDIAIFDASVAANIAYARPGASREDVEAAAQAAAADEFIRDLPKGYDTRLGVDGLRLSGGQRQRIAIARAILKDAPILLLDEATSALDTESERQVQASLDSLRAGRTTIVIAHRLSTIRDADCIHVLRDGQIVESGPHLDLLAAGGLYAALHETQASQPDETPDQVTEAHPV